MKIIQLNIWGGKLGYQIMDFLQSEQPDFVCMQEVHDLEGSAGATFATLHEIQQAVGLESVFMSPIYDFHYMNRTVFYGNAMLSKIAPTSSKTIFVGKQYKKNFDVVTDDYNIRNLQVATFQMKQKTMHVLNHHGHHIHGTKEGSPETLRQMQKVAQVIEGLEGAVILTGDFNLSPRSQSLELINAKLTNLSAKHNLTRTYTELSNVQEVCDYIFVNPQITVKRFLASDQVVSDHKALILEFEL